MSWGNVTMKLNMHASLLLLHFLASLTGVCVLSARVLRIKAGEMVVLQCPPYRRYSDDVKLLWTRHTTQEHLNLTDSTSPSAEQSQMGVLIHGTTLVILRASANHHGNYSCSRGNASSQFWFTLDVYTPHSEHGERTMYTSACYAQSACALHCPGESSTSLKALNITPNGITWHKEGKSSPEDGHFSSVDEKDSGVYTCTRSYLYHGQIHNMTFTVALDVRPQKKSGNPKILAPLQDDVFNVDLGSQVVIVCEAVGYSDFDDVFWLIGESFVDTDDSLPVFYNSTRKKNTADIRMTASLVFKKVSKEDLLKTYTCKLESVHQASSFVTITLTQKARPLFLSLTLCIVGIVVVIAVSVALYVKRKRP